MKKNKAGWEYREDRKPEQEDEASSYEEGDPCQRLGV